MGKIRVLIVDDAPVWRATLRSMLVGSQDIEVVGEAGDGTQALQAALDLRPDVLLLDLQLPGRDGIEVAEVIGGQLPAAAIVVSVESRPDAFRRAMKAGVSDYLVKPFGADELVTAVRAAAERAAHKGPGGGATPLSATPCARKVAFFSGCGGAGKTTLAVNLGTWIALSGRRTILADLDLESGVAAMLLGVQPRGTLLDLCRREGALDREVVSKVLVRAGWGDMRVLAPPPEPHLAAEVDGEARRQASRPYVAEVIGVLAGMCEYLILDAQSTFREATVSALDAADVVMVVTRPDIPSLYRTGRVLDLLLDRLGYAADKVVVVLNQYDPQHHLSVEEVSRGLDHPLTHVIPADPATVVGAADLGQPFVLKRSGGQVARAVAGMGEALTGVRSACAPECGATVPAARLPGPALLLPARVRRGLPLLGRKSRAAGRTGSTTEPAAAAGPAPGAGLAPAEGTR